jgi:hypothetical protein
LRRLAAPRPPTGPRPRVRPIRVDDADEHVDQGSAFGGREHRQDSILCRLCLRALPVVERLSFPAQSKHPRTAIRAVHGTFDQTLLLQSIHDRAGGRPVERHAFGQGVLIQPGRLVQVDHHAELERDQSSPLVDLRCDRDGNLVEPAAEGDRRA